MRMSILDFKIRWLSDGHVKNEYDSPMIMHGNARCTIPTMLSMDKCLSNFSTLGGIGRAACVLAPSKNRQMPHANTTERHTGDLAETSNRTGAAKISGANFSC